MHIRAETDVPDSELGTEGYQRPNRARYAPNTARQEKRAAMTGRVSAGGSAPRKR
jgi:hypothetical protein